MAATQTQSVSKRSLASMVDRIDSVLVSAPNISYHTIVLGREFGNLDREDAKFLRDRYVTRGWEYTVIRETETDQQGDVFYIYKLVLNK